MWNSRNHSPPCVSRAPAMPPPAAPTGSSISEGSPPPRLWQKRSPPSLQVWSQQLSPNLQNCNMDLSLGFWCVSKGFHF